MKISKFFISFDYILFFSTILLTILSIFFIYSANLSKPELHYDYIKQIIFAIIGLTFLIAILFLPTKYLTSLSLWFYIILILGLIITLFFPYVKGQRRLSILGFSLQFSEFMKIATILLLSTFLAKKTEEEKKKLETYLKAILIVIIPVGLILLQPDLGTMLVFIPILLAICFMAGIKKRYLLYTILFIFAVAFIPTITAINHLFFNNENEIINLILNIKYITIFLTIILITIIISIFALFNIIKGIDERFRIFFYWYVFFASIILIGITISFPVNKYVLKEYQRDRLLIFFNPEFDKKGKGFHIIQSKNTIGNGGLLGKGWTKGDLTQNYFLPEQATDFIYPVIAEEMGFIGSLLIVLLYSLIFFRGLTILFNAKDYINAYIVTGILAMLLFHILESMGMCLGIMPITGIPLPFLSYGGSFLITSYIAIGILMNINMNRYNLYDY
ncbi:MAG TPA: rod shape-determining protein RodA [Spirochaetota bacterium]|nr:rod shape-determining protein RodA [Spirochaetota bacterium]HOL56179.1 rod shape-determining protein RodA [Spirochaetota bacterium]HPP03783.1 rod shape-determining protein RodA [Spirochaetota bacterium]